MINFKVGIEGPYFNKELAAKIPLKEEIKLTGMDRIEILMGLCEEGLDYAGGIPVVSTVTGAVRFVYGAMQVVTALTFKIIGMVGCACASRKEMGEWEKFNNKATYHIKEGAKNVARGLLETIPVVNLALWDLISKRDNIGVFKGNYEYHILHKTEQGTDSLYCNRAFYDGELKRMHIFNQLNSVIA